jgi:hypothetical protein
MAKSDNLQGPRVSLESSIQDMRGQKVIFDRDLAELYGVPTKALNQAVKRNRDRFPVEFVFQLTRSEWLEVNRSQTVTGSQRNRDPRFLPFAFTEHGALMAANVLNSPRAVQMSVAVVQTFIRLRRLALSIEELVRKVEAIEQTTAANSAEIQQLISVVQQLMNPPAPARREIGFHTREQAPR